MTELAKAVMAYINFLEGDDYHEDMLSKFENQVFEKAMEEIMGKDIWNRVSAAMDMQDQK